MKHLLILVILFFTVQEASAQKPWKWTQLHGPNNGLTTEQLIWGANGEIINVVQNGYYVSTNDGSSWDFRKIANFTAGSYEPNSTLIITGTGTYYFLVSSSYPQRDSDLIGIYTSFDHGNSWTHQIKKMNIINVVEGLDGTLYFDSRNGNSDKIYESIDKGGSWVENPNIENPLYYYSTSLIGSNAIGLFTVFSGNGYQINKFTNVDQKSVELSKGLPPNINLSFIMINSTLFAYSDSCLYSTDGINKWDTLCSLKNINSMSKGNGNAILAAVQQNHSGLITIFSSTNQGKSWDSIAIINPNMNQTGNYQYSYANPDKLLYEDDYAIHLSVNKGGSWSEIGFPIATVHKVIVGPDNRIFAMQGTDQNYPTTFQSNSNGNSWHNTFPAYYSIDQIGKGISGSIMCLSRDRSGSSCIWEFDSTLLMLWKKKAIVQDIQVNFSLGSIASDQSKYIYVADGNVIYRSDDNAFSWIDIEAPNTGNNISALDASSDGTLYFGTYPIMYRSDDHGATWVKLEPVHDIVKLTHIKTFGKSSVLLGTEGDGLMLSNDKGNTWERIDGNNFDTVTCVSITSRGEIAAGTNRGLWISDTSQHKWSRVILGKDSELQIGGIDVAKNDDFYVGTYGSSVWVGTRNYNGIKNISPEGSVMRLSPNPASDKITISLDLPSESSIKLEIFDALGKRVAIAADGKYSGDEQMVLNSSALSNGIYTAVLSGDKNETQKFIIAR